MVGIQHNPPVGKNEFLIEDAVLGKGSYSVVKMALPGPSSKHLAAKIIDLYRHKDIFEREVKALTRLNHPNIVQCIHSQQYNDGRGVIFLEYLPHPTLFSYVQEEGPLCEPLALHVLDQLVDALVHMHQKGIAHLDVKSENVSYDEVTSFVKVFDFGLSITVNPYLPMIDNYTGSPLYMAPEVLMRERYDPFLADLWSLGIVFYEMLVGDNPFAHCFCVDELLDFVAFEDHVAIPTTISTGVAELLNKLLSFVPSSRPVLHQLKIDVQVLASGLLSRDITT